MKVITNPAQVPTKEHIGVIVFGNVFVPGDERSRTNPGHGYPDHFETSIEYYVFDSVEELG